MDGERLRPANDLDVHFHQQGDRYGHVVFWKDQPLAESMEGDDQAAWPPSPPMQQLSIEQAQDGPVGLMLGMAGRSHWSLSVHGDGEGRLIFEAACRVAGEDPPEGLGSSYRWVRGGSPIETTDSVVVFEDNSARWRWVADQGGPFQQAQWLWQADTGVLQLQVQPAEPDAPTRWRYRLERQAE